MKLTDIAKTLLLPLKARALAHQDPNILFQDILANNIWQQTDMSFEEGTHTSFIEMIVARTKLFDRMLQDVLQTKKTTLIVNLGAGLCTRAKRFTNKENQLRWLYVDVEEVINLRKTYFEEEEYTKVLNLKNTDQWLVLLKEIFEIEVDQILFMAEGVFSYFTEQEFTNFTEKIIEETAFSSKKVSFCFDCTHPNYGFKTAFENVDAFEDISFSKNYENVEGFVSSLSVKPVIKKYRLPFNVIANIDYERFVMNHQGQEPYYASKLDFNRTDIQPKILGTYFEKSMQLNSAYSQTFLKSGSCFFNTKNNFYVINTQDWIKLKSYLEDAESFAMSFEEIQIFYSIEKLISANILVENNQQSFNNDYCLIENHFFPNKFWAENKEINSLITNYIKEDVNLVFTHDLYDVKAQNYVKELLSNQQKCCVIVLEQERILVSPLFLDTTNFNLYVNCIELNVPHLVWAKQHSHEDIEIPCSTNVFLTEDAASWLLNYLTESSDKQKITEYKYKDKSIDKHVIADYETLEKTSFLSLDKELITDKSSGYRTKLSADILKDCESQISKVSGVVSPPKILANLSDKLVTYTCTYPTRIPFDTFENKTFFNQSLGKGLNKQQSKVSAIAEAFERFSMNFNGKEDYFLETYTSKLDDQYVNPLMLFNFSEQQYKEGVYKKIKEETSIYWTQGISLTQNIEKFLPAVLCFQNAPFEERKSLRFSSNGCATGNTVKEAILQGLLELVERDAVALWWYQKRICQGMDISKHQEFVDLLKESGWNVWVLNVTTNIEIPVMVAVAQNIKSNEFRLGFGAHLDVDIAMARAISEVHQIIEVAEFAKAEFDFSNIKSEVYLFPDGIKQQEVISNVKTIDDAITSIQSKIENLGFEVLYKNLSRSNLSLKTVKVFVPGLCFIWPEYGNIRLYKNSKNKILFSEEGLNSLALFV